MRLVCVSSFTPSAYSNTVNLWCENVGILSLPSVKSLLSVYTLSDSLASNIENCQK